MVKALLQIGAWVAWIVSAAINVWDTYGRVHSYADELQRMGLPVWLSNLFPAGLLIATSLWVIGSYWVASKDKTDAAEEQARRAGERAERAERERTHLEYTLNLYKKMCEAPPPPVSLGPMAVLELPHNRDADVLRERKRVIEATLSLRELQIEQKKAISALRQIKSWKRIPKGWEDQNDPLRAWSGLYRVMLDRYQGQITPVSELGDFELQRRGSSECLALVVREIEYPDWEPTEKEKDDAFERGARFEH